MKKIYLIVTAPTLYTLVAPDRCPHSRICSYYFHSRSKGKKVSNESRRYSRGLTSTLARKSNGLDSLEKSSCSASLIPVERVKKQLKALAMYWRDEILIIQVVGILFSQGRASSRRVLGCFSSTLPVHNPAMYFWLWTLFLLSSTKNCCEVAGPCIIICLSLSKPRTDEQRLNVDPSTPM